MMYDKNELRGREVERTFIHCTATSNPNTSVEDLRRWHVDQNGWSDIGYHYYIDTGAVLHKCRPLSSTPAAQKGHNTGTIAICLNGLVESDFNEAQFEVLRHVCQEINAAHPEMTFHGHKEVAAKDCPVFDYKEVLGLNDFGEMKPTVVVTPDTSSTFEDIGWSDIASAYMDMSRLYHDLSRLYHDLSQAHERMARLAEEKAKV